MTTEPTSNAAPRPQPLRVEWRDAAGPLPVVFFRQKAARVRILGVAAAALGRRGFGSMARGFRAWGGRTAPGRSGPSAGFTLLELLVVLAIIGLMASLTLPHLKGFSKSNSMTAATRQLLDDVAFARQRAMVNRSTVLMVFVPPNPWNFVPQQLMQSLNGRALTNLMTSPYRGYALLSLRSVGDQPGQPHPSYITDWKTLPSGVYIAPYQYSNANPALALTTTNVLSASTNGALVAPFPINTNVYIPFPTLQYTSTNLPYIGFSPDGMLVDVSGAPLGDQYIALTSGGIFYLRDDVGGLMYQPPLITESPAGEWTNNPTLIHIDATTARAKIERNQF